MHSYAKQHPPLNLALSNWSCYQFCSRWKMALPKALIWLDKSVLWAFCWCETFPIKARMFEKQLSEGYHTVGRSWKYSTDRHTFQEVFLWAFKVTLPSISPILPEHNQCLPTRLPSSSCQVTTSHLLRNVSLILSVLNLVMSLFYPLTGLTSWLQRGCPVCTQASFFIYFFNPLLHCPSGLFKSRKEQI